MSQLVGKLKLKGKIIFITEKFKVLTQVKRCWIETEQYNVPWHVIKTVKTAMQLQKQKTQKFSVYS
jgi:hypothetical protein